LALWPCSRHCPAVLKRQFRRRPLPHLQAISRARGVRLGWPCRCRPGAPERKRADGQTQSRSRVSGLVRCVLAQSVLGAGAAAIAPGRAARASSSAGRAWFAPWRNRAQPGRAAAKPLSWTRGSCPDPAPGSATVSARQEPALLAGCRRWQQPGGGRPVRERAHGPPSRQAPGASIRTVSAATNVSTPGVPRRADRRIGRGEWLGRRARTTSVATTECALMARPLGYEPILGLANRRDATQSAGPGSAAPTPWHPGRICVPADGFGWAFSSPLAWSQSMRRQHPAAGVVGARLPQAGTHR